MPHLRLRNSNAALSVGGICANAATPLRSLRSLRSDLNLVWVVEVVAERYKNINARWTSSWVSSPWIS